MVVHHVLELFGKQSNVVRTILLQFLHGVALLGFWKFRDLVALRSIALLFLFHRVLELTSEIVLRSLEMYTTRTSSQLPATRTSVIALSASVYAIFHYSFRFVVDNCWEFVS